VTNGSRGCEELILDLKNHRSSLHGHLKLGAHDVDCAPPATGRITDSDLASSRRDSSLPLGPMRLNPTGLPYTSAMGNVTCGREHSGAKALRLRRRLLKSSNSSAGVFSLGAGPGQVGNARTQLLPRIPSTCCIILQQQIPVWCHKDLALPNAIRQPW